MCVFGCLARHAPLNVDNVKIPHISLLLFGPNEQIRILLIFSHFYFSSSEFMAWSTIGVVFISQSFSAVVDVESWQMLLVFNITHAPIDRNGGPLWYLTTSRALFLFSMMSLCRRWPNRLSIADASPPICLSHLSSGFVRLEPVDRRNMVPSY